MPDTFKTFDTTTKRILPFILATAIFMQMLDSTILNTSLPSIAKDLNESPLNMQTVSYTHLDVYKRQIQLGGFQIVFGFD